MELAVDLLDLNTVMSGQFVFQLFIAAEADHVATQPAFQGKGGIDGLYPAVVDDGDTVTVFRLFHVVGGHEHGNADLFAQAVDVFPNGIAALRVQADGGLIQEQHLGIVQQAAGDLQAAFHAPGEGFHQGLAPVRQVDDLKHLLHALFQHRAGDVIEQAVELEILFCRQSIIQRWVLEDDADGAPHLGRVLDHIMPGQGGTATAGLEQGAEDLDGGRLARPIGADKAEHLTLADAEAHLIDRGKAIEFFAQPFNFDDVQASLLFCMFGIKVNICRFDNSLLAQAPLPAMMPIPEIRSQTHVCRHSSMLPT